MPRTSDFLARFRPAGSPGMASAAGVPVDRAADLAAELEPVLHRLADTEAVCDQVLERARAAGAARRARDTEEARAIVAEALARSGAERAAAEAASCEHGREGLEAARAAAAHEVDALRARAAGRVAHHVDLVVATVQAVSAPLPTTVPEPP